jgi:hypothetical protein
MKLPKCRVSGYSIIRTPSKSARNSWFREKDFIPSFGQQNSVGKGKKMKLWFFLML